MKSNQHAHQHTRIHMHCRFWIFFATQWMRISFTKIPCILLSSSNSSRVAYNKRIIIALCSGRRLKLSRDGCLILSLRIGCVYVNRQIVHLTWRQKYQIIKIHEHSHVNPPKDKLPRRNKEEMAKTMYWKSHCNFPFFVISSSEHPFSSIFSLSMCQLNDFTQLCAYQYSRFSMETHTHKLTCISFSCYQFGSYQEMFT